MSVTVEKVAEGVRITLTYDTSKKPAVVTVSPDQLAALSSVLQMAGAASAGFKLSFSLGGK